MKKKPILKISLISLLAALPVVVLCFYNSQNSAPEVQLPVYQETIPTQEANTSVPLDESYQKLIEAIKADLTTEMEQPNILKEDIERGWYFSSEEGKKFGTPDSWVFMDAGRNSKWSDPDFEEEDLMDTDEKLCSQTGGQYIFSCANSTQTQCQYQEENLCKCPEKTKWKEAQGCILINEKGSFVSLNSLELKQGFYTGLSTQKKLNTPEDWEWVEAGENSTWRNH